MRLEDRTLGAARASLDDQDLALVRLGQALKALSYQFVTVTPETHRRVLMRDERTARDLRDVFGWSRAFGPATLPESIWSLGVEADIFAPVETGVFKATVRFSTLGERLLLHSAFPTVEAHSVFFGPDSYRFCALIRRSSLRGGSLVDVGCGTGVGGLVASSRANRVVLSDINPVALRFARVNAAIANIDVEVADSDVLSGVGGRIDAVIANPPYLLDAGRRLYRDGGGRHGEALSVRIAGEALTRLSPGGTLLLYTGAPIVDGRDTVREPIEALCREAGASFSYEELDPDVFGEQLSDVAYEAVDRIAAVSLLAVMPGRA